MVRRPSTAADYELIRHTLYRITVEATGKAMHRGVNPGKALERIFDFQVWFVDGFLVVFDVGSPWYSTDTILSELLVVRVGPGGTLAGVAQFFRDQAKELGADLIAVGTAFAKSDRALSRLYQAEGFKPEAITLTMEP